MATMAIMAAKKIGEHVTKFIGYIGIDEIYRGYKDWVEERKWKEEARVFEEKRRMALDLKMKQMEEQKNNSVYRGLKDLYASKKKEAEANAMNGKDFKFERDQVKKKNSIVGPFAAGNYWP